MTGPISLPNKKISIDFDGVLLHLFLGREWISDDITQKLLKGRLQAGSPRYCGRLQNLWLEYYQRIRKPTPGTATALKTLKERGFDLCLVTSRREFLRPASENWLQRRGLIDCFSQLLFNDTGKHGIEFKVETIKALDIAAHIDDSTTVVSRLAPKFPQKRFVLFGKLKAGNLPKNVMAVPSWPDLVSRLKG